MVSPEVDACWIRRGHSIVHTCYQNHDLKRYECHRNMGRTLEHVLFFGFPREFLPSLALSCKVIVWLRRNGSKVWWFHRPQGEEWRHWVGAVHAHWINSFNVTNFFFVDFCPASSLLIIRKNNLDVQACGADVCRDWILLNLTALNWFDGGQRRRMFAAKTSKSYPAPSWFLSKLREQWVMRWCVFRSRMHFMDFPKRRRPVGSFVI